MGKQVNSDYTPAQKCDYYKKRVNDRSLTQKQRDYAQKRLNALCGTDKPKSSPAKTKPQYTDAQKYSYGAGIGYATAKKGKRVKVKDENKESFRAGYKKVK